MILTPVIQILLALTFTASVNHSAEITWKELDKGLYFTETEAPIKSDIGNSKITILKIDPAYFHFNLISSKEKQSKNTTAVKWAEKENLIAVVNAGMFHLDFETNVGYMKNYEFVNNGNLNNDNTILAFNRKTDTVPEVQIIDLKCQEWSVLSKAYHSYTQGIRMIDCNQKNRWSQQDKRFSIVCIAVDKDGFVLFIFSRSPYSGHDLINNLLTLPLNLHNAMYLEGGPEASIYITNNGFKFGAMGSFETDFNENDNNNRFWDIPNVIGIVKK